MDSATLLAELNADELVIEAPSAIAWKLGIVDSADGVAQFMYKGGPHPMASADCGSSENRRPDRSH